MITYINDNLFIGDQWDANSPPPFVTALLWVALETPVAPPDHCVVARLPLREFAKPDLVDLQGGVDWLTTHLPSQKILVACRQGLGRSPSIVIAYLCCRKQLSFQAAVDQVREKRPGTTPLPELSWVIEELKAKETVENPR